MFVHSISLAPRRTYAHENRLCFEAMRVAVYYKMMDKGLLAKKNKNVQKAYESLLLGNVYAPITRGVVFVHADLETCVDTYVRWAKDYRKLPSSTKIHRRQMSGGVEDALKTLLPVSNWPTRLVFLSTQLNGWTAIFENSAQGPDFGSLQYVFCNHYGLESLAVHDIPNTYDPQTNKGVRGLRGGARFHPDSEWKTHRIVTIGKHNYLFPSGENFPYPQEPLEVVREKILQDPKYRSPKPRLTHKIFEEKLAEKGFYPFKTDFYAPDNSFVFVEESGPEVNPVSVLLAEARKDREDAFGY